MAVGKFAWVLIAFALVAGGARAETLPLPGNLVDFNSPDGEHFLVESDADAAYFPLASQFVTQKTQAYCGIASLTMVLNAMGVPAPTSPEYGSYKFFTQDNALNTETDAILPRELLARQGTTLDQLGALVSYHGLAAEVHHAGDETIDSFRAQARTALGNHDQYVLINYLRAALGQQQGGHISPLAAYDAKQDKFLILDVARYKYPPVWVSAEDLYKAMNTVDAVNAGKTRGYVLIAKKGG
jgi:Phytochelatin synthase